MTPLEDQQIGGLIMWASAALVYIAAGLARLDSAAGRPVDVVRGRSGAQGGGHHRRRSPRGKAAIAKYGCDSCHTIGGAATARGQVGPPLTGVGRRTYVAGVLPNTPENMARWIREPRAVDEKTAMPTLGVSDRDAADIVAYLYSTR